MEADEAGRAGDEDRVSHPSPVTSRHRSIPSGFCARSSFDLTSSTMPSPAFEQLAISGQPPRT